MPIFKHIPEYSRLNPDQIRLQTHYLYINIDESRVFSIQFLNRYNEYCSCVCWSRELARLGRLVGHHHQHLDFV